MTPVVLSIAFFIGLFFGSFASVLITRIKNKKPGIFGGRSECPSCHARLSPSELIPLLSYILSRGRCRSCHTHISLFYPLLEITMGIAFMSIAWVLLSYAVFFPGAWILLCILAFITVLYAAYDILYMEVPDEILVPSIFWLVLLLLVATLIPSFGETLFWYFPSDAFLWEGLLGAFFIYTFFYLQILIPWVLFTLKKKNYSLLRDIFVWYFIFPFTLPRLLSRNEEPDTSEEIPTWIWAGDLRIALFIGLSLWGYLAIWFLIFTYISGALIGIVILVIIRRLGVRVAFWPILAWWWFMTLVLSWYTERIIGFFLL